MMKHRGQANGQRKDKACNVEQVLDRHFITEEKEIEQKKAEEPILVLHHREVQQIDRHANVQNENGNSCTKENKSFQQFSPPPRELTEH